MAVADKIERTESAGPRRVADLLGGARLLHHRIDTPLDAHDLIVGGMPAGALNHLMDKLLTVRHASGFEKALGMSLRTRQRRKDTPAKALNAEQGGRVWKFAEVLTRATDVFGSQSEAEQWLVRPAMGLDQRAPIELLASPAGAEVVEDFLTRIEYGAYT
ncbi:type II RES/Xre toxin-antitoxin system antitoxin [Caulobacter sp. LARHSG274]